MTPEILALLQKFAERTQAPACTSLFSGLTKSLVSPRKRELGVWRPSTKKRDESSFLFWVCRAWNCGLEQEMVLPLATLMMKITVAPQLGACCMLEVCSESICRARFFRGFKNKKMKKLFFWVSCWPLSYLRWSQQGEIKWPQCLSSQTIKFYVQLNPGRLRVSVNQVLMHIFPRPQRLSAMDQEIFIRNYSLSPCPLHDKSCCCLSAAAHFTCYLKDGLAFKGMSALSAADKHMLCSELELPFPRSCADM